MKDVGKIDDKDKDTDKVLASGNLPSEVWSFYMSAFTASSIGGVFGPCRGMVS